MPHIHGLHSTMEVQNVLDKPARITSGVVLQTFEAVPVLNRGSNIFTVEFPPTVSRFVMAVSVLERVCLDMTLGAETHVTNPKAAELLGEHAKVAPPQEDTPLNCQTMQMRDEEVQKEVRLATKRTMMMTSKMDDVVTHTDYMMNIDKAWGKLQRELFPVLQRRWRVLDRVSADAKLRLRVPEGGKAPTSCALAIWSVITLDVGDNGELRMLDTPLRI